jgi:hypothetical protein
LVYSGETNFYPFGQKVDSFLVKNGLKGEQSIRNNNKKIIFAGRGVTMGSITVQFLSASDFSFGTQLATTHGAVTNTSLNWNYNTYDVDIQRAINGTMNNAMIGSHAWTSSKDGAVGAIHEPQITATTHPALSSMVNTNTRFYTGNPYDPCDLSGGVIRLDINDANMRLVAQLLPVYTLDGSNNRSAFQGYVLLSRMGYLQDGAQYNVTFSSNRYESSLYLITDNFIMCFLSGTRIAVPSGETPVERIRVGDSVVTGNGPQLVSWISSSCKDCANSAPVVFTPAALASPALSLAEGAILPERPLKVSQQHCMVVTDDRARAFIGTDTFLLAAKHLINGDTIYLDHSAGEVEYFHLMFEQHQIVLAESAWSESFYPGPEALKNLTAAQKQDIYEVAPDLMDDPTHGYGPTALPRLTGGEYKRLLKGKGPTPGQKLRRQKLRCVTADDMPPRASDLPVVGDVEITAMPVPPLVHRNMPAHSTLRH